jgi:uracil-DNA glycosylase
LQNNPKTSLAAASAFASLDQLAGEMRSCRKCVTILGRYGVEPRPIFHGGAGQPILLIGQAPGKTEYERNAPFQGEAGDTIRSLLESCGLRDFDRKVYQTSVTKCFPGRNKKESGDRAPSAREIANCSRFLVQQLSSLQPKLVVCLGMPAAKAYVVMREREEAGYCRATFGKASTGDLRVPDLVGHRFMWKGASIVPMIHTSPRANDSRSRYADLDWESKRLLCEAVKALL